MQPEMAEDDAKLPAEIEEAADEEMVDEATAAETSTAGNINC